jgi:hypothetical protein
MNAMVAHWGGCGQLARPDVVGKQKRSHEKLSTGMAFVTLVLAQHDLASH